MLSDAGITSKEKSNLEVLRSTGLNFATVFPNLKVSICMF